MHCAFGGDILFTACPPDGYRLRLVVGASLALVLSREEVERLITRMKEVLAEEDA